MKNLLFALYITKEQQLYTSNNTQSWILHFWKKLITSSEARSSIGKEWKSNKSNKGKLLLTIWNLQRIGLNTGPFSLWCHHYSWEKQPEISNKTFFFKQKRKWNSLSWKEWQQENSCFLLSSSIIFSSEKSNILQLILAGPKITISRGSLSQAIYSTCHVQAGKVYYFICKLKLLLYRADTALSYSCTQFFLPFIEELLATTIQNNNKKSYRPIYSISNPDLRHSAQEISRLLGFFGDVGNINQYRFQCILPQQY